MSQIATDLDIRPDMLRRWKQRLEKDGGDAFPGKGQLSSDAQKLRDLERENQRLREERAILKKALVIFSERPR